MTSLRATGRNLAPIIVSGLGSQQVDSLTRVLEGDGYTVASGPDIKPKKVKQSDSKQGRDRNRRGQRQRRN